MMGLDEALAQLPYPVAGVISALVGVLAEGALLVAVLRQRRVALALEESARAQRWPELAAIDADRTKWLVRIAFMGPLPVLATTLVSCVHVWDLLRRANVEVEPSTKATLLSTAISGQMNALAFGLASLLLIASLGVVALPVAIATRARLRGLQRAADLVGRGLVREAAAWSAAPGPRVAAAFSSAVLFYGMAFVPVARAGLLYCTSIIHAFAAIAGKDPADKLVMLDRALAVGRVTLQAGHEAALVGLALAALITGVLWLLHSPERSRLEHLTRTTAGTPDAAAISHVRDAHPPAIASLAWLGAAVLAAVGLVVAAQPLRAENTMPWPPVSTSGDLLILPIPTPALRGPDQIHRAPVLAVTPGIVQLDGANVDGEDVHYRLLTLRQNYQLLHPGEAFGGELVVVCAPATPALRLGDQLGQGITAGYDQLMFAFIEHTHQHRPLYGDFDRVTNTAARVAAIVEGASHDAAIPGDPEVRIKLADFSTCDDLARRIVDVRNQGHDVALSVRVKTDE